MKHPSRLACALMVSAACLLAGGVSARAAETRVVALGASSTAGKGVAPEATYPAQLQQMLAARGYAIRIVNAGINGDTSAGMLARLDADVPDGTDLVILQTGTNDAREDGHDENIAAIVDRLRARSIEVVPFKTSLMRDLRAGYSQADGHHLTAEGYRILAARLLPLVERAIHR
ncbi:GDSL-type esterase/lipase family protein [Methylobacterium sp. sgz302541]|uniref:GDSL-type esterase/lipase family protein n=1 Tax=unclassified Methylobacterium TaxID=2615210 RepID=UPI003D33B433